MAFSGTARVSEGTWRGLKGAGLTCCPVAPAPNHLQAPLPNLPWVLWAFLEGKEDQRWEEKT